MRISENTFQYVIRPWKMSLTDTPHSTIETNRTCNINCRGCYNLDRSSVKSLAEIKAEIDQACRTRKLQAITLLGGEPTLHADITRVIEYVKTKGVTCQILTNGLTLLQDRDEGFLQALQVAGIDKVLVHIDPGQSHVHPDIDDARRRIFDKLERRGIHFSLSITIYNDYAGMIPALVRQYAGYECFDGILSILARDPRPPSSQTVQMADECRSISKDLGIEPTGYIPSNLDDRDVGWLAYLYYINADTGAAFALSPSFERVFRMLHKLVAKRELFTISFPRFTFLPVLWMAGALELLPRPKRLSEFLRLLSKSRMTKSIRFHYIIIQNPPEFDEERQAYRFCYHCPDATIRNGRLTPVCVADQINPLQDQVDQISIDKQLRREVYEHLALPG